MSLVIAGGPSIDDYPREKLTELAEYAFTFAVNEVAFDFPCDVVVSIDPNVPIQRKADFMKLGKPLITRDWGGEFRKRMEGVELIELPEDVWKVAYYSGMVAAKLSDRLMASCTERKSYVIGIDASFGRYKNHKGNDLKWHYNKTSLEAYENLGLSQTVNLSVHSKVSCWPKSSKLPGIDKVIVHPTFKAVALAWLKAEAAKEMYYGLKK